MRAWGMLVGIGFLVGSVDSCDAHPPEASTRPAAVYPSGLILPAIEGPKPWTDKPHLNDPDRFQIAIVTDHTGGHRPGIWMKAMDRLNLLRPEFVMSVGDLIEGYSTDEAKMRGEWKEFLGQLDRLQMRFFFVPGNHDLTNPLLHNLWREKFGRKWYSFDYKGVHFVALSSEEPDTTLGKEQLAWLEEDLKQHAGARWTLLFFHKPLWTTAERDEAAGNPDSTGWRQVERMLGARPHTVFAGHVHHYVQYDRRGMKYYHLATTGGASPLRGVPYGEFDHITWLTMEKTGPTVAHLQLDGILAPDAVTEPGIARFREFLAKASLEIAPILIEDEAGLAQGRIDLRLTNGFSTAVEVKGRIEGLPLRGLTVDPQALVVSAEPGQTRELALRVHFTERIPLAQLSQTVLVATFKSLEAEKPLVAEKLIPVIIDRKHPLPAVAAPIVLDGSLAEWGELAYALPARPTIVGEEQQWRGEKDAGLRFDLRHDQQNLYLSARISDDRLLPGADAVTFRIDARPAGQRGGESRVGRGGCAIRVAVPAEGKPVKAEARTAAGDTLPSTSKAALSAVEGGYVVEVAVPAAWVALHQGAAWQSVQVTAVVSDSDNEQEKPIDLYWRGTEGAVIRNTGWGFFVRQPPAAAGKETRGE